MTPRQAQNDATALLGAFTRVLRLLTVPGGCRMHDALDVDHALSLSRWIDGFPIEDEVTQYRDHHNYIVVNLPDKDVPDPTR